MAATTNIKDIFLEELNQERHSEHDLAYHFDLLLSEDDCFPIEERDAVFSAFSSKNIEDFWNSCDEKTRAVLVGACIERFLEHEAYVSQQRKELFAKIKEMEAFVRGSE